MDLDLREESDFEPSDEHNSLSEDEDPYHQQSSGTRPSSRALLSREGISFTGLPPSSKWERLQPLYNDRYLELFQETAYIAPDYLQGSGYVTSQIGAVMWEAAEKARFFQALPSIGRHDLPQLSHRVGTKSMLEVKSYLNQLENAEIDRQLFEKQTKNISQADVPAAVEIGAECETRLEQAADALSAFQEQYDYTLGQQDTALPFIVNLDVAFQLDETTDEVVKNGDDLSEEAREHSQNPHEIFNLATFIELSEKFFMHGSRRHPDDNWRALAEDGEKPAVTQQVIADFHELVVSILRRLMQTTLFLTQSRLKASTTKHQALQRAVTAEDVHSAVIVLKLKDEVWDYWTNLPRRFGFRVVSGSHRRGDNVKKALTYDEVENYLSVRQTSGRRRSLSVASGDSNRSSAESDLSSSVPGEVESSFEITDTEEQIDENALPDTEHELPNGEETIEEETREASPVHHIRLPSNKRKRLLEEELDQYLEEMDQQSRQDEEARLISHLGMEDLDLIKQEPIELGRRPKVLRKSVEEVAIWKPVYHSEWESYPRSLSENSNAREGDIGLTQTEEKGKV